MRTEAEASGYLEAKALAAGDGHAFDADGNDRAGAEELQVVADTIG